MAAVFSGTALLISIALLIKHKKGFWWYVGAFLFISPIAGGIGWALGRDEPKQITNT